MIKFLLSLFRPTPPPVVPRTPAEETLDTIRDILFPPMTVSKDEKDQVFMIDWAVDSNIMAAFSDVNSGYTDDTVQQTLLLASERLVKVRELLQVSTEIHPDTKYFAVSHPKDTSLPASVLQGPSVL